MPTIRVLAAIAFLLAHTEVRGFALHPAQIAAFPFAEVEAR